MREVSGGWLQAVLLFLSWVALQVVPVTWLLVAADAGRAWTRYWLMAGSLSGSILILISFLWVLGFAFMTPRRHAVLFAVVMIFYVFVGQFRVVREEIAPVVVNQMFILSLLLAISMTLNWVRASASARFAHRTLIRYVPPQVVAHVIGDGDGGPREAEVCARRQISVLFCDLQGFTTVSESLPPEVIGDMLGEYCEIVSVCVGRTGGVLDKFIGDAAMAIWGAPVYSTEHAVMAVEAAILIQSRIQIYNDRAVSTHLPRIRLGVGIDTGEMLVGCMGSSDRLAYTAVGDHVNLAARIEKATREYSVPVLLSRDTAMLAAHRFVFVDIDRIRVRGRAEPVHVVAPLARKVDLDSRIRIRWLEHQSAVYRWYRGDRSGAAARFRKLVASDPGLFFDYYKIMLERCVSGSVSRMAG